MFRLTKLAAAVGVAAIAALAFGVNAHAAQQKPFEPQVGQSGKDVVWVPTPDATVEISLTAGNRTFRGNVNGDSITGTVTGGAGGSFVATKQ